MKKKILFFICFISVGSIFSQSRATCPVVNIAYDEFGNRISRLQGQITCRLMAPDTPADIPSNLAFNVYPNPTQDQVKIELTKGKEELSSSVVLYDMNGKTVYKGVVQNKQLTIDISSLTPGTYMLYLMQGEEKITYTIYKY